MVVRIMPIASIGFAATSLTTCLEYPVVFAFATLCPVVVSAAWWENKLRLDISIPPNVDLIAVSSFRRWYDVYAF
jgi:hypothetical protein